jgi:inner membrane protein
LDTITQGLLGAACGQAALGHRLGRRALLFGALGGLLPDLDVLPIAVLGSLAEWKYHRGLTHTLWFGPVVGPALGYVAWRAHRSRARAGADPPGAWRDWGWLFVLALFTHPLLDAFTTYGTLLLWPFSSHRFALDAVAIVDPVYSLILFASLALGAAWGPGRLRSRLAAGAALALSTAFLLYALALNRRAEASAAAWLPGASWTVDAYPTLFQPWLRRVVAREGSEVRVGFLSLLRPRPIEWRGFTDVGGPLVEAVYDTPEGRLLRWFAMDRTAARVASGPGGALVEIEDLRYGWGRDPSQGLWGIRARFDDAGRMLGPPTRFNRRPADAGEALARIWRETFVSATRMSAPSPGHRRPAPRSGAR